MEETPNSEKVFKADLVIIAAGFLGPEKTLAEQFGIKKVRLSCFYPKLCSLVGFLGIFCIMFLQDPRSNFATEKNKFLTSVPKVYAAGGEILHHSFSSTFPSNPERMSSVFLFIFSTPAFGSSGTRFPNDLGTRQFFFLSIFLTRVFRAPGTRLSNDLGTRRAFPAGSIFSTRAFRTLGTRLPGRHFLTIISK